MQELGGRGNWSTEAASHLYLLTVYGGRYNVPAAFHHGVSPRHSRFGTDVVSPYAILRSPSLFPFTKYFTFIIRTVRSTIYISNYYFKVLSTRQNFNVKLQLTIVYCQCDSTRAGISEEQQHHLTYQCQGKLIQLT
jgi:hypothetical protein